MSELLLVGWRVARTLMEQGVALTHAGAVSHAEGGAAGLSAEIGKHSFYCLGKGWCTPAAGSFFGPEFNIDTILMTIVSMVIVLALALVVRAGLELERPRGLQNVLETIFEFINGLVAENLGGERTRSIGPFAVALFIFLVVANWIGLVPIPGFHSPTSDLNTTLGLALLVFVMMHVLGARKHKGGYARHVFEYPAMAPLTVIEELSRPVTLSFRLFGNIFAGEVLILVFTTLIGGLLIPVLPLALGGAFFLGLFVGAIQAFIFTVLTIAYIGISTGGEEAHH